MKKEETILITGGCGFIGHRLALALKKIGKNIIVYDSLDYEYKFPVYRKFIDMRLKKLKEAKIPIVQENTTNKRCLTETIAAYRPDRVAHMAAIVSAEICDKLPDKGYNFNLNATQMLLEVLRQQKQIKQLVFPSSSMVYGHFSSEKVTEESPLNPIGIYGATKLGAEHLIRAYHNIYGLPYTIVRPSALYGPTCINRRVGQIFIECAIQGIPMFLEGAGKSRLDFTNIDDLIQGIVLIFTRKEALNQTFNLTYGDSRKIKDLARLIKERYPKAQFEDRPWKKSVPRRGTLDISKARELLGFKPEYPLEKGFPLYMDWYDRIGFNNMLGRQ